MKNQTSRPAEISTDSSAEEIRAFFGIPDAGGQSLNSATYYACIQIRCNSIAKLPLKVMHRVKDNTEVALDQPLYYLLHDRPNPYTTRHDFLWQTEFERLTYGNAFWYPVFEGGKFTALYQLHAPNVTITVDDVGLLSDKNRVYYEYLDDGGGNYLFQSDEVLHFKNFPNGRYKGAGVGQYLHDVISNERQSARILKEKYKKGLQDPIVVQFIGDLSKEKQAKIHKKFEDLGGSHNAGKAIIVPPDYKLTQLETKLVNSQFFELQGLTTRHIANAFGVKSFQLNDLEKSTYTNIENQNRAYYSDTLVNALTVYEEEINYKLFSDAEKPHYFSQFNVDAFLRSDPETRYKNYQIGIASGFLMPSEARQMDNLPFIPGTDRLIYGNGAAIPLDQVGIQYQKGGD
jgi:HK97 family phage portal protein